MSARASVDVEPLDGATRSRVDQARVVAKELLPWGGLATFIVAAVFGELGPELKKLLIEWGPGLLIFLVVMQQAPAFVRATQRQADAMSALAGEFKELPRRDDLKFQDLALGQELILRKLAEIDGRLPR